MTKRETLLALKARVDAATGGDRELDFDLLAAFGFKEGVDPTLLESRLGKGEHETSLPLAMCSALLSALSAQAVEAGE